MTRKVHIGETEVEFLDEAERDAQVARSVSGRRCRDCRYRSPDPDLERCPKCDGYMASIDRRELRLATCRSCKESFLWRYSFTRERIRGQALEAPDQCRACKEVEGALWKEREAFRQRQRAVEIRKTQRAAVARFKPRERT